MPPMHKGNTLAIGAGVAGLGYLALRSMEDFKTPGVKNIEAAHSRGGGGAYGTPAIASKRGDADSTQGRQLGDKGKL